MIDPYQEIEGINISTFNLRPHHVMIRWLKKEETKGGILLPQNRQRKSFMIGSVLKVGPECVENLIIGSKVQFNSMCDKEFLGPQDPSDRDTVFIMIDDEIHGIIKEGEKSSFHPFHDFVMIKQDEHKKEVCGLVAPVDPRMPMEPREGVVISVGEGVKPVDEVVAGCKVLFDPVMCDEVIMNGETFTLVRLSAILGIIE
jgi:co-chaperonin GroES (HSP10)